MTHRGPFQPLLFCDSVILWTAESHFFKKKTSSSNLGWFQLKVSFLWASSACCPRTSPSFWIACGSLLLTITKAREGLEKVLSLAGLQRNLTRSHTSQTKRGGLHQLEGTPRWNLHHQLACLSVATYPVAPRLSSCRQLWQREYFCNDHGHQGARVLERERHCLGGQRAVGEV